MNARELRVRIALSIAGCATIGLVTASVSRAGAQVKPDNITINSSNPYRMLDSTALLFNKSDDQSVREIANAVFSFPRVLPRMPEMIENPIKDRLVQAELAYRLDTSKGVREEDVVKLVNSVADKLGLPSYSKTNSRQVRVLRMQLAFSSPAFMAAGLTHENMKVGESVAGSMSPLQAVHLIHSLVDQKLINPEFQVEPEQWERVHSASVQGKIEQIQRMQASSRLDRKPRETGTRIVHTNRDLHDALSKAGSSLGFLETMDLIDQAFTTLRIGR